MKYFLGIDPDMHEMPLAIVDENGALVHVQIIEVSKKITGREALVAMISELQLTVYPPFSHMACTVEAQEIYQFGQSKTKNPKSIMFLATVAGAAMQKFGIHQIYFPTPQEWKGTAPKQIHQGRVLGRMGISYTQVGTHSDGYCVPTDLMRFPNSAIDLKKGQWKHVVDAIGLAQYGREKFMEEEARKTRLA